MQASLIEIIREYEEGNMSGEEVFRNIKEKTGKDIDSYTLNNYWRSQSLESFVENLCELPKSDWEELDDLRVISFVEELRQNPCNDNLNNRILEALCKHFGKTEEQVEELVFNENITPKQVLNSLSKDTRIIL